MNLLTKDKKNIVILLLLALFLLKVPGEGFRFLFWAIGGVFCASISDFYISRLYYKRNIFPKSAIITGFIITGIMDYRQGWWFVLIFVSLAIVSKYFIRFKKTHVFNPANFGLFFAQLFKVPLTWNIESNILLIIIVGIYLAYSYKKIPHVLGFLIFFLPLFAVQRLNPYGLISWFFLFIMLIEPKTSGYGNIRGFVFGSITAVFSFLIFRFLPGYDFLVCSLFLANLANPVFLDKIKT